MVADQRPRRRVRPEARRLDDLDARVRDGRVARRAERHPHQPLDRRRPHVGSPGHDLARPSAFYDKNWIACDTWPTEPVLRQLLHGVGRHRARQPDPDEHVDRRRPHVEPAGLARRAAVRSRRRCPSSSRTGHVVVPYTANFSGIRVFRSENGGDELDELDAVASQTTHSVAAGLRASAAPVGRGRRGRQGLRRLARLPLPRRVHRERHRHEHDDGRIHVVSGRADPDRPGDERRRPLHPRHRRRPGHLRRHGAARPHVLLLPGQRLLVEHVRPHGRLRLVARRRRRPGRRRRRSRGR